jgi:hypothetical protein
MAIAVIIVWLNRRKMFGKGQGVTEVLMPGEEDTRTTVRHSQTEVGMSEA